MLAEIVRKSLNGKLTLQWVDLRKEIHFRSGRICGVLSNQEGEKFVECVLQEHRITAQQARKVTSESNDSYQQYSSLTRDANPEARRAMARDLQSLATKILKGLFRQTMGDFIFEEGEFTEQYGLDLDGREILLLGIKQWMDQDIVRQRISAEGCRIELKRDFQEILKGFPASPSDVFLLFRFDRSIEFDQLQLITGIPEHEFSRLIYLFSSLGVLELKEEKEFANVSPNRKFALHYQEQNLRLQHEGVA